MCSMELSTYFSNLNNTYNLLANMLINIYIVIIIIIVGFSIKRISSFYAYIFLSTSSTVF